MNINNLKSGDLFTIDEPNTLYIYFDNFKFDPHASIKLQLTSTGLTVSMKTFPDETTVTRLDNRIIVNAIRKLLERTSR